MHALFALIAVLALVAAGVMGGQTERGDSRLPRSFLTPLFFCSWLVFAGASFSGRWFRFHFIFQSLADSSAHSTGYPQRKSITLPLSLGLSAE